jgi:hypothetical protein
MHNPIYGRILEKLQDRNYQRMEGMSGDSRPADPAKIAIVMIIAFNKRAIVAI